MESGLSGQYQSAFRGLGLEFEEVREYRAGDDVRTIDWNVTARTGFLHIKRYREERDLNVLLLVDLSASTRFGSKVMTVHDLIAEVAGLFALAAARRDRVGAILFDEGVRTVIPPRLGWKHGLRVVREVLAAEPRGGSSSPTRPAPCLGNSWWRSADGTRSFLSVSVMTCSKTASTVRPCRWWMVRAVAAL
jgi:uncharacterized protein (DUF58 family)